MPPGAVSRGLVQVGFAVLRTTVNATTKKILAYLGSDQGETDSENAEWWQHVGFASRPSKPQPGKAAAQAVSVNGGDRDVVIASQDLRGLALYGNLKDGETCVYAAGEDGTAQARLLLKADGSIHLFTTEGNVEGGKGIVFSVRADGSIDLVSSKGTALQIATDGTARLFSKGASLQVKGDGGVKVTATQKVEISGTAITLGGSPAGSAVVGATELGAFVEALAAGLDAITPGSTTTGGAPAATAVRAAGAALKAALAAKRTTAD